MVKSSASKLAAMRNLVNLYRAMYAAKGLDVAQRLTNWARQKRKLLDEFSAGDSFDQLCETGCHEIPLAILLSMIHPLNSFEKKWKEITGTSRQRERRSRTLEKAADVLEALLASIDGPNPTMDEADETSIRQQLASGNKEMLSAAQLGFPDPAVVIHFLRTLASLLGAVEATQKSAGVSSSDSFTKYLFSAYVLRATGRFHDMEVSALVSVALSVTYDETAHRMWRSRNYKRADLKLSKVADILADFGAVVGT